MKRIKQPIIIFLILIFAWCFKLQAYADSMYVVSTAEEAETRARQINGKIVMGGWLGQLEYVTSANAVFIKDEGGFGIHYDSVFLYKLGEFNHDTRTISSVASICGEGISSGYSGLVTPYDVGGGASPISSVYLIHEDGDVSSLYDGSRDKVEISSSVIEKATKCYAELKSKHDKKGLESVELFIDNARKLNIIWFASTQYEVTQGEPGDDWLPTSIIVKGNDPSKLTIESQSISVMQCTSEGPHIELYNWKLGTSPWMPLEKKDGQFLVGKTTVTPEFPKYTDSELESAQKLFDKKDCAPRFGGTKYRIKRGNDVLFEMILKPTMGC